MGKHRTGCLRCALLVWLLLGPGPAAGSGFMISKMGGDLAGATEPNPAAVFWNPAALGDVAGLEVMLDFNLAWRDLDFDRHWPEEFDRGERPDSPGTMSTFNVLPMAALALRPKLNWLVLGAAFYVPYGHRSDWPAYDPAEQLARPAEQREPLPPQAFHSLRGGIRAFYTTGAVALCPLCGWGVDWLWLGLSASWVRAELDSIRLKDYAPEINETLGFEFAAPEQLQYSGLAELDFAGDGWALAVGLYARPVEWLRLGVSWTSQTRLVLPGRVALQLPELLAGVLGTDRQVESSAELHLVLPPALRVGLHLDLTDWLVLRLNLEYVHWQVFEELRIQSLQFADEEGPVAGLADTTEFILPKHWGPAVDVRGGFRIYLARWLMLFAGLGYDSNAVPAAVVDPSLYDAAKLGLAGGVWLQPVALLERLLGRDLDRDDRCDLALGATWVHFLPRDGSGSELEPPLAGHYRSEAVLFDLNLVTRF